MKHGDGNFMTTIGGRRFWPLDPRADDLDIEDIATSLSFLCRFNGHVKEHYSVAQHSVIVSAWVPEEDALFGLLHDAAEAYIGDMTRPLKHDPKMARFKECDITLTALIYAKFCGSLDEPASVKEIDQLLLQDEVRDIARQTDRGAGYVHGPGLGIRISGWPAEEARHRFIRRFYELHGVKK